ncbi:MAG: trypsin-like peptidase domain-containing protein [Deltaproteobacteria bacterium]|nr:trypsin-like peptidase domain-containing protein [Deltaproteobacteria bacterium]
MYRQPGIQEPVEKKNSSLLVVCSVCIVLLICGGAAFFLMQKYNIQITAQNDATGSSSDRHHEPAVAERATADQLSPVATSVNNAELNIGDLFNKVNPAVATVITYDSGNNKFSQGSGFFINRDGHFITNYHVIKGAYSIVVQLQDKVEWDVAYVLAENEGKDLVRLAVDIPGGSLEPGMWLDINPELPDVADKIIVVGTPMGLGRTVSDGIISAVREIPDRGLVYQMTAPISRGSSGSPVIDMYGRVVGVAFLQVLDGQNLNFAIPSENIVSLKAQHLLSVAAWSKKSTTRADKNIEMLRKEIVKHIRPGQAEEKIEQEEEPLANSRALKAELASQIIKESGITRQNETLTGMILASFEEKYEEAGIRSKAKADELLARYSDVIKLATNPERINTYIQDNLAAELTIPELQQVLKWYQTPLGKKISEIEYNSYAEKRDHVNMLRLAHRLTRYQSAERANLFARLDEATSSTELMIELQTNLIVQNQILDLILLENKRLNRASIDEIIKKYKDEIDPYLDIFSSQYVFAGFTYTYRGLSIKELEKYIAFSETEAGRHFYSLLRKKSNRVLLDCNKKILTSIVRVVNNDSWDNIRKDLDEPIREV